MGENKFSVIFDLLKADILSGKYAGGRPLPSASALMRRFGVARATAVARATPKRRISAGALGSGLPSANFPARMSALSRSNITLNLFSPMMPSSWGKLYHNCHSRAHDKRNVAMRL